MLELDRTPVSDELRQAIFEEFKTKSHPNILKFEIGKKPGEIIFFTTDGYIPCLVTEDERFLYYEMPSGTQDRKMFKSSFLRKIGFV